MGYGDSYYGYGSQERDEEREIASELRKLEYRKQCLADSKLLVEYRAMVDDAYRMIKGDASVSDDEKLKFLSEYFKPIVQTSDVQSVLDRASELLKSDPGYDDDLDFKMDEVYAVDLSAEQISFTEDDVIDPQPTVLTDGGDV